MAAFKSGDMSRADFNAKAKVLSDRLGPIVKNEKAPRSPKWHDRARPPLTKVVEQSEASEPETDAAEEV